MAGSLAFYSGMTPGISRMVSSIADDTAYNKGYALQANSMHDMASARKADADALKIRHEITSGDDAAINHVLGTYNLTKPEFDAFKAARTNGTPLPAGTNEGPGFSQGQIERYNNALRDHAAMMTRKPHDVSQFATQMAQLPAVQASVDAARRVDSKSASEIMMNQAALGKDVMQDHNSTDVKTWNWLQSQPPAVQKAYTANQIAMRQAGATSVNNMTPVEMVDPATGNKVYGEAVLRMRDDVSVGYPVNMAMKQLNLFPHMVIQMTGIGEEAGALDAMLFKVAEYYEQEVNNAVDALSSLLEPMIMVFIGTIVGGLVIAMYLPIFKLGAVVG